MYFVYIRIYVGVCLCVRGCVWMYVCVCMEACACVATTQDLDGMMELTHAERGAHLIIDDERVYDDVVDVYMYCL